MSAAADGGWVVPISRRRALVVRPFRRDDDETHPEAMFRPWATFGPVFHEGRAAGVAATGPRRCVMVLVVDRPQTPGD